MLRFEDLSEGGTLPVRQLEPIRQIDVVRYAGASGDFNPIHTIPDYARGAGLPSTIVHGMMSMDFLSTLLTDWIGLDARLVKFGVRFAAMTFPGDVLTLSGIITKKYTDPDPRIDVDLSISKQDGSVTVKGWATIEWKKQ